MINKAFDSKRIHGMLGFSIHDQLADRFAGAGRITHAGSAMAGGDDELRAPGHRADDGQVASSLNGFPAWRFLLVPVSPPSLIPPTKPGNLSSYFTLIQSSLAGSGPGFFHSVGISVVRHIISPAFAVWTSFLNFR